MPPSSTKIHLDEISQAIGELKASAKATERYVHDWRHSVNNLTQKVDGLGAEISRQIAATEARIGVRLDSMDRRISALEDDRSRREGALSVGNWIAKHGASIGAIVVGAVAVIVIVLRVTGQLP